MKINIFTFVLFLFLSQVTMANVSLPAIFNDNMVLQCNSEVSIWGWGNPNEEIKIKPSWYN